MPRRLAGTIAAVVIVAWAAGLALHGRAQFSSSITLVEVYATVTSTGGAPVHDLTATDFTVTDDGEPREIVTFASGAFPLSVGLAIDRSFSMSGARLAFVQEAALRFLAALRPEDEATVIGISSEVETLAPLSRDRAAQRLAVSQLTPWGTTKLHDAVIESFARIAATRGRRALVILTDGDDRGSRASADDVIARVRASDVLCYAVVVGRRNSALFAQLAAFTGGRTFWVRDASTLDDAFVSIAEELRQQYLIGFTPAQAGGEGARRFRRIALRTPGRDTSIRARPGYFTNSP